MSRSKLPNVKKGQPAVYLVLLVLVIVSMVFLKRCGNSKAVADIVYPKGDTINVAIEYAPLSCYMYNDTLGGYCYDLLKMIEAKSHRPIKIMPMVGLKKSLADLREGKYDILVAEFPVTAEDKEDYLFTEPVYLDREVLVQRVQKDGKLKVNSQLDLAKDTIYIVKESPMRTRLENLSREIGDTIYVKTDEHYGPEQLFLRVATGEIDYAVVNEKLAKAMVGKYPNVNVQTGISFTQFQSWVLDKKNQALCDSVNVWLGEVKKSPSFKQMEKRYFK